MPEFTARQIAELVEGELIGPADVMVRGVEALDRAAADQLTFIGDAEYARRWPDSAARVALVSRRLDVPRREGETLIAVDDADLAMARVLEAFAPPWPTPPVGVDPTAVVDPTARLGEEVRIGPHACIGPGAVVGERCVIHGRVNIMAETRIGPDAVLWPGVVVRDRCTLGARCIVHPNAVIGADGFGYRPSPDGRAVVKIPQIGRVEIGDDVEIGANTCIDRGKFAATVVGDQTKIDNLVQIGHNCRIGRGVIIVAQCAIGGSVVIEDGAVLGGQAAVRDHLCIGVGGRLAANSALMHDLPAGESWAGVPAKPARRFFRELSALGQLPDLLRQFKKQRKSD
jgi:UDP-3-O-[3-hydroxymyristoyl] glucosamine N-acyltransferase